MTTTEARPTKARMLQQFPPGTVVRLLPADEPHELDGKLGTISHWTSTPRAYVVVDSEYPGSVYSLHRDQFEPTGEMSGVAASICINTKNQYLASRKWATLNVAKTRQHLESDCVGAECDHFGPSADDYRRQQHEIAESIAKNGEHFPGQIEKVRNRPRSSSWAFAGNCQGYLDAMLEVNPWLAEGAT